MLTLLRLTDDRKLYFDDVSYQVLVCPLISHRAALKKSKTPLNLYIMPIYEDMRKNNDCQVYFKK